MVWAASFESNFRAKTGAVLILQPTELNVGIVQSYLHNPLFCSCYQNHISCNPLWRRCDDAVDNTIHMPSPSSKILPHDIIGMSGGVEFALRERTTVDHDTYDVHQNQ